MELKYKSWDDISVRAYRELAEIEADASTEEAILSTSIEALAYLCGCTAEEVEELPVDEFTFLMAKANFIRTIEERAIPEDIVINGKAYDLVTDMGDFITAQYIDWQSLSIDAKGNLPRLLACILIPKGCDKYGRGYDVEKVVADIDNHLPFIDAYSILRFFASAQSLSNADTLRMKMKMARLMELATRDKKRKAQLRKEAAIAASLLRFSGWSL